MEVFIEPSHGDSGKRETHLETWPGIDKHDRHSKHDRHDRHDRHGRYDRQSRHGRHTQHDRHERHDDVTDMSDIPDMTDAISAGRQAKDRITDFWCRCGLWFFCRITCVAMWLCVSIQVDSLWIQSLRLEKSWGWFCTSLLLIYKFAYMICVLGTYNFHISSLGTIELSSS